MMAEPISNDDSYQLTSMAPPSIMMNRSSSHTPHGSLQFDPSFSFDPSLNTTISPASLELFHTSHDDNCLDNCKGSFDSQGFPRGGFAPPPMARSRFATSSISSLPFNFQSSDNTFYQQPSQQFNHMSADIFRDMGLRYDLNLDNKYNHNTSNYEAQLGNSFSAADLGTTSNGPLPDDCTSINCSQISCSSQCCSTQVCQDESCLGDGTPCREMHCFENISPSMEQMWNLGTDWNTSMQTELTTQAHNQPCNHTNTEHDVAITLRDLSAPGASNTGPQQPPGVFPQFECSIFGTGNDAEHHDRELSLSLDSHTDLSCMPDVQAPPISPGGVSQVPNGSSEHVCQWIVERAGNDMQNTICGLVFNNPVDLQHHLCQGHIASMSSRTKYLCLWKGCSRRGDQVFASRNKLRRHISTHTAYKPFTCPHCHQGFSAQQALDQHIRTHTGEKPYCCDVEGCGKSFKQKSALTMHKRTHTGEKPLTCEVCGKKFCESSNLSKHRKTHNPDYKYKCEEPGCDSRFIRVDQLRRHAARHSNKGMRQKKKQRARSLVSVTGSSEDPTSPQTPQFPLPLDNDHLDL
ncbi:hypothetical protein F4810DRAFT_492084 [Camillea tinctor]|nr:hypothetical protein F4810DRAFT_492084 [Camillea tinctor]